MGEICHPRGVPDICICCAIKGLKTNHDYLVESMESKSPKEIQVEEKITEFVTKIVDGQTSGDDLPMRLWNSLRNNQEIAAIQNYANMVSIGRLRLNEHGPVHMKTVIF